MAKVTFLVEGSRAGTITVPVEIEGENGDRLLNWVMRSHPKLNADGSPASPDPQHSVAAFVDVLVRDVLSRVEADEKSAAIAAALAAIPPIETKK
jgi:hypothetical protein